jgi:Ras-related GTP-binding protein C/D
MCDIDLLTDILTLYSAQGSPNNMSVSDTPDRNNGLLLDGQQTPVSLDHDRMDPDSESLERRLIEHQHEQQQQQQQMTPTSDAEASSLIKLDNGDVLYMREVNR